MTAILIARFLLDLQTAERQALCMNSSALGASHGGASQSDSLVFERVMGSLTSSIGDLGGDGGFGDEEQVGLEEETDQSSVSG